MPNLAAEIAGRLQPKRIARKDDVHHHEHQSRQQNFPPSSLRCRWQGYDGEHVWFLAVLKLWHQNTSLSRSPCRSASARCFLTSDQKFFRARDFGQWVVDEYRARNNHRFIRSTINASLIPAPAFIQNSPRGTLSPRFLTKSGKSALIEKHFASCDTTKLSSSLVFGSR
jgi:hypothetical protein